MPIEAGALDNQGALAQAWGASQQLQGQEAGHLRLLDGLQGWQVYFFRDRSWTNAQSSADTVLQAAPPPVPASGASGPAAGQRAIQRSLLPTGVRLQLALPEGQLTRDVMLSPQML